MYDAIVVLGSQPDYKTWKFPSHTYALDKAIDLINQGTAPYLALSGDHALKFDNVGITQPYKESDKMEEYALSKGLAKEKILKENKSLDTAANLYYLKNLVFKPNNIHKVLLITADFRVERIKFLWQKIMGPDYSVTFDEVTYGDNEIYKNDAAVLEKQKEWLKNVKDGDDAWFLDKFYDDPYYLYYKKRDQERLKTNANDHDKYLI
jgi:uncharacterized SAM-binding protein YcdF (DUF218 family)